MRLLHFADLHLDAPFLWAAPATAERRRQALRDTLETIVELAHRLRADALLCGGDLYEQATFTPDTAAFLRRTFERAHPLPVLIAPGNHDWLAPGSVYARGPWSPNVTIFRSDHLEPVELADGLTVWGAAYVAPTRRSGFLEGFRTGRAGVHLALFHGAAQGGFFAGLGHAPHAPFTEAQIRGAGLDHALVGHYHTASGGERFTYPGNPDPLSFGETPGRDGPRGAVLAAVGADGTVTRERWQVARSQVHDVGVDVSGCGSGQEVRERVRQALAGRGGCARVTLKGEVAHEIDLRPELLRDLAPELEELVAVIGDVRPAYDIGRIQAERTVRGQFVRDVMAAPDLTSEQRRRVLITGLRALDGRSDLEAG